MRRLAILAAVAVLWTCGASAQQLDLGSDGAPIEVDAAHSLEWHSEEKVYVARGDARLRRGDVELRAETLTAHYRELPDGGTEIWRVTADGGVVVETPSERAQGARGAYDVDRNVFVLSGGDLRLVTADGVVTAEDSLEYWRGRQLAVARGNAVAVQRAANGGESRIAADVLTARFAPASGGDLEMQAISAQGGVTITTPTDVARGDEGVYDLSTRIATLSGNVRLTRGGNQLNGDYAEVNLETGVSRLLSRPGTGEGRVRGLLVPDSANSRQQPQ